MGNKITPREREHVIANIKKRVDNCTRFYGTAAADAIQANYCDDNECWNKLLALIESAPIEKNIHAVELADMLEEAFGETEYIYSAIAQCLGYDVTETTGKEDFKNLCDAIRNLDASEDGMKYPLDANGVPIKPNDKVYYIGDSSKEYTVGGYEFTASDNLFVTCLIGDIGRELYSYCPGALAHKKPRTIDDIKTDVYYASHLNLTNLAGPEYVNAIYKLIDEAYNMGKEAGNEETRKV